MDHLADAPIANILILAGVIFLAVGLFGRIGGFIGSIFGNIEAGKNSRVLAGVLGSVLIVGGAWMHQQSDKSAPHAAPSPDSAANSTNKANPAPEPNTLSKATPPGTRPDADAAQAKIAANAFSSKEARSHVAPTLSADRVRLPASTKGVGDDRLIGTWTNVIPPQQFTSVARIQISRAESGLEAHIWVKCGSGECDYGIHSLALSGNTATYEFANGNRRWVGSMNVYAPNVLLLSVDSYEPGTTHHWHHNRVFSNSNLQGPVQTAFSTYLDAPGQKAFAMAPSGRCSWHLKASTADEAAQRALQNCQNHGWPDCRIILLNDEGPQ
jgi:hypothetical protein